jgi:alanyl-tRNA synthetase
VSASSARILAEIGREEAAFSATLSKGQKLLDDMLAAAATAAGSNGSNGQAVLAGSDAFLLYDSFGFPLELTQVSTSGTGTRNLGGWS